MKMGDLKSEQLDICNNKSRPGTNNNACIVEPEATTLVPLATMDQANTNNSGTNHNNNSTGNNHNNNNNSLTPSRDRVSLAWSKHPGAVSSSIAKDKLLITTNSTNPNNKTTITRQQQQARPAAAGTNNNATSNLSSDDLTQGLLELSFGDASTDATSQDDLEDEGCSMGLSSSDTSSVGGELEDDDSDSKLDETEAESSSRSSSAAGSVVVAATIPTTVVINGKQLDLSSPRYSVLTFEQVMRLDSVMDESMPIHGRGNFPTLEIKLKDLVQVVRAKLLEEGIVVRDIRLNGGAASYVLSSENPRHYTDLDLIFGVDLSDLSNFDRVRTAVLESLLDFLPEGVATKRMSSCTLKEAYVHKMVKVTEGGDRWSLISLTNHTGRDVELKFVDTMRRQFEFSVDSFQIILDSLLRFYECSEGMRMSGNFYPTVIGDSVYGNFCEALSHLRRKVVATRNPEEIRGGGLLKYCRLLVKGYRPAKYDEIKNLERYMCSRFFIDFSDLSVQRIKLEAYLTTHFPDDDQTKYDYLTILHRVVDESTVCLMGHERRQTLNLIEELAYHFYYQDQQRQMAKHQYGQHQAYVLGSPGHYYYTPYYHQPSFHHQTATHHQVNCMGCHCGGWMPCA